MITSDGAWIKRLPVRNRLSNNSGGCFEKTQADAVPQLDAGLTAKISSHNLNKWAAGRNGQPIQ